MKLFRRLSILDRYIIGELISPFIFGMAAFSFILAGSTVLFPLIGEASKYGMSAVHVIQLFVYKFPSIIVFTFPMSTLLATLLCFGRLNNDLEIIAFRAGGISFRRLVIPVIIVGFFISSITIFFSESIVPISANSAENLFRSYRHKTDPTIKENINLTEYKNKLPKRIINVKEVVKGQMQDVTVAEFDDGILSRIIRSKEGKWIPSGGWEFYEGTMYQLPLTESKKIYVLEFEKEYIDIQINPFDFTNRKKKAEEMSALELKQQIEINALTGQPVTKDIMNFHLKFAVPFASLIFSILGASVGLKPHRSSSALGLGVSLVIILIYYVLLSVGMGLGLSGILPPVIAAWLPNIIVGSIGLYQLKLLSGQ